MPASLRRPTELGEVDDGKAAGDAQRPPPKRPTEVDFARKDSKVRRALRRWSRRQARLRSKLSGQNWGKHLLGRYADELGDELDASSDQQLAEGGANSVSTLDLFKYAGWRERLAVLAGLVFMWYAASWQPISVFILAIMASLMGQYSKQTDWLHQLANQTGSLGNQQQQLPPTLNQSTSTPTHFGPPAPAAPPAASSSFDGSEAASFLLGPIYSLVRPIFDELTSSSSSSSSSGLQGDEDSHARLVAAAQSQQQQQQPATTSERINAAVRDIMEHESRQFLRKSFEINGSAFVLALTQLASFFVGMTLITWAAKRQASRLKLLYFRSCLHQEPRWFETARDGSGASLNALIERYEDGIGAKLALLAYFLGHVALFALTAFYQQFNLAAFCMPFVGLVCLVIAYLSERQARAIGLQAHYAKRACQLAEEIIGSIRTVFAFNGQQKELARYEESLAPVHRKSLVKHLYTALNTSLSKFSIFACFSAYCFYAMRLFPPYDPLGPHSKATILAVMRGAEVSIVNILISIPFMEALQQSKGSVARIYAAIERRSSIDASSGSGLRLPSGWLPTISFRQARFGYGARTSTQPPPATKDAPAYHLQLSNSETALGGAKNPEGQQQEAPILDNFSLEIKSGQTVALVGPSGSGKSTVLALVQRLYDLDEGQLLVGQHEVRQLDVAWLRGQIGVVAQEPRLFDMSIEENIRLGLAPSSSTKKSDLELRQQVVEAARLAGAHNFIERLPQGYATRVGSGGHQLSGGQKQRIAIARALIRRPKLLLLDETTSALDAESEARVQAALKTASRGRTTLMVAHRLQTVQQADLIVVMEAGRVVESGRHEQLLVKSPVGLYRRMWEEQTQSSAQEIGLKGSSSSIDEEEEGAPSDIGDLTTDELATSSCSMGSSSCSEEDDYDSSDEISEDEDEDEDAEEEDEEREPSLRQLWEFLEMPKFASMAAALVCLAAGLILPMNLIAHSYLFSAFAYEELEQIGDYLHAFGLIILSFSGFVFIVSFLQVLLPGWVGERLSSRLRLKLMTALLRKPVCYFDLESHSPGPLCDQVNAHIQSVQAMAGARASCLLEALSTLTVGAFYGFGQNLQLSLFCLSFALLVLVTTIIESKIVQLESKRQARCDSRLAQLMAESLGNIKTIASLNQEHHFLHQFKLVLKERERGVGPRLTSLKTFLTSLKFVMPALSWSASMHYGCHLLTTRQIDLQTIFIVCPVVLFAVNDTFRALVFLPELLKARHSVAQLRRLHRQCSPELLRRLTLGEQLAQQSRLAGCPPAPLPADTPDYMRTAATGSGRRRSRLNSLVPRQPARGRLEFRRVEFAYPGRPGARVLADLTLQVAPGESVALVGGSGSGKSSCVALLEKFYDYQAGEVLLDGRDLRLCEPHWVRQQIGLVQQEPQLLSVSIGDNIRYGDNSRQVPLHEVMEAAKLANIHDFIMSLPEQYDTPLGSLGGSSRLSGGQRQRLAIARALVRRAPILVFDEATSALDSRNERQVEEALERARQGRTSITIAHRLSAARHLDRILVLHQGRLVESGRHEELLRRPNGHYRALWERQQQQQLER